MEIAIPHTGKAVLRSLMKHCRTRSFSYFFFCLFVFSLCGTLDIPKYYEGKQLRLFFFLFFHHSLLNRLQRSGGIIITSDFKKCLLTSSIHLLTNLNIDTSNLNASRITSRMSPVWYRATCPSQAKHTRPCPWNVSFQDPFKLPFNFYKQEKFLPLL